MSKVVSTIGIVLGLYAVFYIIVEIIGLITRRYCVNSLKQWCGLKVLYYLIIGIFILYPFTLYMLLKKFRII